MLYRCYAKINLTLEVLGKRADGFHELSSLAHTINLADDLRIEPADEIVTRVEGIEAIENNLVTRAAYLLGSTANVRAGAELTLVKRIPTAAGLGGGSSDAAATLVGLNALWQTRIGYHALGALAAQLGSDVPFFLRGGAAVMRGRGDVLEAVPPLVGQWLVLAMPSHTLPHKTAVLYRALEAADFSSGEATDAAATQLAQGTLADGALCNAFARAAREVFPGLATTWAELEGWCGRRFHLSGAGPALFALAESRMEANAVARRIKASGVDAIAARTVKHARTSIRSAAFRYA